MESDSIVAAVTALTQYARRFPDINGWEIFNRPTDTEIAERRAAIEAICDEMDALARNVDACFWDFETLRREIESIFPPIPPDLLAAVVLAYSFVGRLGCPPLI